MCTITSPTGVDVMETLVLAYTVVLSTVLYCAWQVLLDEVHTVWPLLVDALAHPDGPVVQAVLGVVLVLLTDAQEKVDTHAATLVRMLLPLCASAKMVVRVAAIKGLTAVAQLPTQKVYPLATQVITGLSSVLDDKKRLVREHAVRCRSAWYLLNSP